MDRGPAPGSSLVARLSRDCSTDRGTASGVARPFTHRGGTAPGSRHWKTSLPSGTRHRRSNPRQRETSMDRGGVEQANLLDAIARSASCCGARRPSPRCARRKSRFAVVPQFGARRRCIGDTGRHFVGKRRSAGCARPFFRPRSGRGDFNPVGDESGGSPPAVDQKSRRSGLRRKHCRSESGHALPH